MLCVDDADVVAKEDSGGTGDAHRTSERDCDSQSHTDSSLWFCTVDTKQDLRLIHKRSFRQRSTIGNRQFHDPSSRFIQFFSISQTRS